MGSLVLFEFVSPLHIFYCVITEEKQFSVVKSSMSFDQNETFDQNYKKEMHCNKIKQLESISAQCCIPYRKESHLNCIALPSKF